MAGTLKQVNSEITNAQAIDAPTDVYGRLLSAATAESIPVPDGANFVMLAGTDNFYANYTATATVPTDSTAGDGAELIGVNKPNAWRRLPAGTGRNISVISAGTPIITACFFL